MTTSVLSPPGVAPVARRALFAGAVGNFVEWYEFGVYGYFAPVIATAFFAPVGAGIGTDAGAAALVATYATFALAFFFRPLGALLFGRLGDRAGRRPALLASLGLMTAATAGIGLLPGQATAGLTAPLLLIALRALQGLSAGGEFGGAVAVLTEFAPPGRRGRYGSWQSATVALGLLAGAATAAALAAVLPPAALYAWGWRIAFLLALPLGAAALCVRVRLPESPGFRPPPADPAPVPLGRPELWRAVLLGAGRIVGWSGAGYAFLVVLPSYLHGTLGTSYRGALLATVLANVGFAVVLVPAGVLSDRVGRRAVMLAGTGLVMVLAVPLFALLRDPGAPAVARGAALLCAGALVGLLAGPGPAMLAEMFPARTRCTALGLAYALANAVFAGGAGLVITYLARVTGRTDVPALYAVGACALSLPALWTLRADDHRGPLR
ncbi:MFS transporter [Streptomyces bambusae]|uniref:MFS transporter n=1 Tax=Streptomyces bambusae TaxID=1550616 RepID=UPI001CFF8A3D|nr:MFS transporter [Streptomyces bambusae]MCB5169495.1 MFS transporter [Streptomyces bambusae]